MHLFLVQNEVLIGLIVCRIPQLLWVHVCNNPCHVQQILFLLHNLLPPALALILFPLPQWCKPWQEWLWYRCPSELHSYLFSAFWPVVSLCVNYCLPYKEASVMRGWLLHSFMGVNIAIYLGVSVIPYPFSNIKVLGLMASPTIGLWPCL